MRSLLWCSVAIALLCTANGTTERERNMPDLYKFPYRGRGDPILSFHHPFEPDDDGDPVSGWLQLGSAMVTSDPHGREMIRLTTSAQANQGLFYAYTKTRNNDFNGWFDIHIETSPDSHEPADGMALFFTNQRPVVGSAMGMSHTIPGLGLVIDTFSNSRTRTTPYLYAYVSDGHKPWNPDTDGADTELAKGCHLELNKPTRIFVNFVDGVLKVGVSFTPHSSEHWHTCFTVDHVNLPFTDGGYLAFAGETGHFFAAHDVLSASFIAEHAYNRRPHDDYHERAHAEREREERERREREERDKRQDHEHFEHHHDYHETSREREDRERREREERERRDREDRERREREERERREREDHSREHSYSSGGSATSRLAGDLDKQVSEVFESISQHMRGYTDRDATETKQRLNGVKDMITHILHEVGRQRTDMQKIVDQLSHLRETSTSLAYATSKFKSHIQGMQKSMHSLRDRTQAMHSKHDDMQDHLEHHQDVVAGMKEGKSDTAFFVLFGVLQVMVIAIALLGSKALGASRKVGRMV